MFSDISSTNSINWFLMAPQSEVGRTILLHIEKIDMAIVRNSAEHVSGLQMGKGVDTGIMSSNLLFDFKYS